MHKRSAACHPAPAVVSKIQSIRYITKAIDAGGGTALMNKKALDDFSTRHGWEEDGVDVRWWRRRCRGDDGDDDGDENGGDGGGDDDDLEYR